MPALAAEMTLVLGALQLVPQFEFVTGRDKVEVFANHLCGFVAVGGCSFWIPLGDASSLSSKHSAWRWPEVLRKTTAARRASAAPGPCSTSHSALCARGSSEDNTSPSITSRRSVRVWLGEAGALLYASIGRDPMSDRISSQAGGYVATKAIPF